jgi:hypothetical protein
MYEGKEIFLQAYVKCVNDRKNMNSETEKRIRKKTNQKLNYNMFKGLPVSENTGLYSRSISYVANAFFQ